MDRPALSVIIPAYNEAAIIASTIATVAAELDRLVPSWELIVVDDGSTNGTFVNGQPVVGRANLRSGDALQVGSTVFRYEGVQ